MSDLPQIEAERSKDFPDYLKVWCPYDECPSDGRPYLVHAKSWLRTIRRISVMRKIYFVTGRSCPYCMRVGRVPSRKSVG